ncbi:hypothetical protein SAMN05216600_11879 [Pseudomonas cuatrocienegasensis]|uniref:Stress responsive A/B Barrel Domain n=1 Tax=Pseudomonas cuatrocienegasensis TaxID=543360 RepID=A0ABY1BN47_9PSED|nr:hypothetical protein SAMN05216600_11879 [Pseudomonas cuatrocienegasensis]
MQADATAELVMHIALLTFDSFNEFDSLVAQAQAGDSAGAEYHHGLAFDVDQALFFQSLEDTPDHFS